MDETKVYVIYTEQEMGKGIKTGHWKIKYNDTTIGELPSKELAITRALAQAPALGADSIIICDGVNENEIIEL